MQHVFGSRLVGAVDIDFRLDDRHEACRDDAPPELVCQSLDPWLDQVALPLVIHALGGGRETIPAGYLELQESPMDGARREAREEARARLEIDALLGVYNIPRISQVQMIYRARLKHPDVAAGEESEAVRLVTWDEIPWDDLAFPVVETTLKRYFRDVRRGTFPFHIEDVTTRMKRDR